jgi:hypothetical protein
VITFLLALAQQPIVIDTTQQPTPTPEVSYGGMLLSAVGLVGVIVLAGLIVGSIIGGIVIWRKRRADETAPPTDPGHQRLRI